MTITTRSGKPLAIRRLTKGDGPALQWFNAALSDATRSVFLPHSYDDATVARYIERSTADIDRAYVVLDGEQIAAYFFLWEFGERVPMLGIGIADAFQGQGMGQQLMRILIEDARTAGRDGIELTTVPTNERAFRLYLSVGFQYVGDVDNVAGDGRVVRERLMFLPLKPGAKPPPRAFKPPI